MTFNNVVDQLQNEIIAAEERFLLSQDPNGPFAAKQYFYLMGQVLAKRYLEKAEDDLDFFKNYLNGFDIDLNQETGGLEILILHLDRNE